MKSPLFLLSLAGLALSGCGQADKQETAKDPAVATTAAAPEAKPGIAVSDGVLVLPAIKDRPGVAYFTVTNGGTAATTLAAVTIDGIGRAEMHETKAGKMTPLSTVALGPGKAVTFARGGKHVMAFDVAPTIKPGATVEMTLTFAGGDKVSTPIAVKEFGDGMGMASDAMAEMDHGSAN
jgi:copper(I)-binding protein